MQQLRLEIRGQVQGVGFRPQVYRIACELGLVGWVKNNGAGVLLEIAGHNAAKFLDELRNNLPPLAKIASIHIEDLPYQPNTNKFEILKSEATDVKTIISPDAAICQQCLQELFDVKSRFHLYPFLNCTHCGPRLTITHNLPYDRSETTMSNFKLCEDCSYDYNDVNNRRYHAQPTACAKCGPQLSMSLKDIAKHILEGKILAIKSLGGYQLVCDANNETTIKKLRLRKNRPAKPFAIMALNLASVQTIAACTQEEKLALNSKERPIVLLKKNGNVLSDLIAPGLSQLGIILPYTPLHYLLFYALLNYPTEFEWLKNYCPVKLIVTSANAKNSPLIIDDADAVMKLDSIGDHVVSYNREIITRVDDTVIKVINNKPVFIRRARGFVPEPIQLAKETPCTLALGAQLKNTFCITRGKEAFVSQHIGNMENAATIEFFQETISHLLKFLNVKPERIACDLHPDFYTSQLAYSYQLPVYSVQHHHAHLAAVIAEHHINEPVLGLALDGYGYGDDHTAWGGELFLLKENHYERIEHFYPINLPGGEQAIREPWRIAVSVLHELGAADEITKRYAKFDNIELLLQMLKQKIYLTPTSSCGRLFDAASALLNINLPTSYEAEAAMKLESLVTQPTILRDGWSIDNKQFDMRPTLKHLLHCNPQEGSNIFHGTLIAGLCQWIEKYCRQFQITKIVLNGGCFLNKILTEGIIKNLSTKNIVALLPKQLPPNDGGISLGQAWLAANS